MNKVLFSILCVLVICANVLNAARQPYRGGLGGDVRRGDDSSWRGGSVEEEIVLKLSDAQVYQLLDATQKREWDHAMTQLKKVDADKRSAEFLLNRRETGGINGDLEGARRRGQDMMAKANEQAEAAQAKLQELRMAAQKRADEIEKAGPQYVYTKSAIAPIEWEQFRDETAGAFLKGLHALDYKTLYFGSVLKWTGKSYQADEAKTKDLVGAFGKADTDVFSLILVKKFTCQQVDDDMVLIPEGAVIPQGTDRKLGVIVVEIIERANAAALLSVRAVDLKSWQIIHEETYQIAEPGKTPADIDAALGDKADFMRYLPDPKANIISQFSFKTPASQLARECSVLLKSALGTIEDVKLSDGDFLLLAYGGSALAQKMADNVNTLWKLDPQVPAPAVEEKAKEEEAKEQPRRGRTWRERMREQQEQEAEKAPEPPKELPPVVLLKTSVSALNLPANATIDVGEFSASVLAPTPAQ